MPKVLLVIGDATEVLDTMYPYFRLPEDGFEVVVAAPEKRLYHMVLHERPPGWDITQETAGYHLQSDIAFSAVVPGDYAGLFLSGGRAPEYIRLDKRVLEIVRHFADADKPIAAICHAAQLLAAAGVLKGRSCSCYPAVAPEVTSSGGTYVELAMDEAITFGNLVTAPAWPAHPAWLAQFLKVLGTRIEL